MSISIVSKNAILRAAISGLCADRGLDVVDVVEDISDVVGSCDVLFLHMTDVDSVARSSLPAQLARLPNMHIVAMVPSESASQFESWLGTDVTAVIAENADSEELVGALVLVAQGYQIRKYLDTSHVKETGAPNRKLSMVLPVVDGSKVEIAPVAANPKSILSDREAAVLAHVRAGETNKAIARALGICDATVKAHLRSSFKRIGATNRTQAAIWATEHLGPNPSE